VAKSKRKKCPCGRNYLKKGQKYCLECQTARDPLPPPSLKEILEIEREEKNFIEVLRANGQLLETSDENAPLPPGVTHILLTKPGQKPKLIRVRIL